MEILKELDTLLCGEEIEYIVMFKQRSRTSARYYDRFLDEEIMDMGKFAELYPEVYAELTGRLGAQNSASIMCIREELSKRKVK